MNCNNGVNNRTIPLGQINQKGDREYNKKDLPFSKKVSIIVSMVALIARNYFVCLPSIIRDGVKCAKERSRAGEKFKDGYQVSCSSPTGEIKDLPLFCIHGWKGRGTDFNSYAENLLASGYKGKIYQIDVPKNRKLSTKKEADTVEKCIEKVMEKEENKRINIVGHSRGGLVAFQLGVNKVLEIQKIITLASPLYGTAMTVFDSFSVKDLGFYSETLKYLRTEIKKQKIELFHAGNKFDTMIVPGESSAILEGTDNDHKFLYHGRHRIVLHSVYPGDKEIAGKCVEWLQSIVKLPKQD